MIEYGLSNIPSLVSAWDLGNPRCWNGVGDTWYDLITGLPTIGNPDWLNNISSLTISMIFEKTNDSPYYSVNRLTKVNGGTGNNTSFYFYHFGNYLGNGDDGSICWYGNNTQDVGTGWINLTPKYTRTKKGFKYHIVLQYSALTGGKMWVNGVRVAGAGSSGILGQTILTTNNTTTNMYQAGALDNGIDRIHHIQYYKRELSDKEILYLYGSHKQRFRLA